MMACVAKTQNQSWRAKHSAPYNSWFLGSLCLAIAPPQHVTDNPQQWVQSCVQQLRALLMTQPASKRAAPRDSWL